MTNLAPWSHPDNTETTEFERQLLEAARSDQVPPLLKLKMADALSCLPPTAATVAGAGTAVQLFSKVGLWGSLSAALLAGIAGWQLHSKHSGAASRLERSAPVLAVAAPAPEPVPVSRAGPEPVAAENPAPLAERGPLSGPEPTHRLGEELALLDRTRAALAEHASTRALHLVDEYTRHFAGGVLRPEADVLRIEALVQRGEIERAARLSRRFAVAHPGHLLSNRVESVVRPRVETDPALSNKP
jgi:hypothetical protein